MTSILVVSFLLCYFIGIAIMQDKPNTGYALTYPMRFTWPFLTMQSFQPLEGALIGVGLALMMSFEHKHLWKIGLVLIIISSLCRTTV